MNSRFQTLADIEASLNGYDGWEFGGRASFEGLVLFAYQNYENFDNDSALMREYLLSVDENPRSYGV